MIRYGAWASEAPKCEIVVNFGPRRPRSVVLSPNVRPGALPDWRVKPKLRLVLSCGYLWVLRLPAAQAVWLDRLASRHAGALKGIKPFSDMNGDSNPPSRDHCLEQLATPTFTTCAATTLRPQSSSPSFVSLDPWPVGSRQIHRNPRVAVAPALPQQGSGAKATPRRPSSPLDPMACWVTANPPQSQGGSRACLAEARQRSQSHPQAPFSR